MIFRFKIFLFLAFFCAAAWGLDKDKYISLDEIEAGMDAYCLTVLEGTAVERFNLKVLSVVRNIRPGRDAILVMGTDERFIHSGPVAGSSGSPVYIDGRLAGALAFGWAFSKDPLYGVTPIEEMFTIGQSKTENPQTCWAADIDYQSIDFDKVYEQLTGFDRQNRGKTSQLNYLPTPLVFNGMPDKICDELTGQFEHLGLMAVAGGGETPDDEKTLKLEPGSLLTIPIVSGDISVVAAGTVTEVVDNNIYAFGHNFLGYGPVNLPMGIGKVHTVVSSLASSFKVASHLQVVGGIFADEASGIKGITGKTVRTIPLKMRVQRYNDAERIYDCNVAENEALTPIMVAMCLDGAVKMAGNLPPRHSLQYSFTIKPQDYEAIRTQNMSSGSDTSDFIKEMMGTTALLMGNPYKKVSIESIDLTVDIKPKLSVSKIWSVDISDETLKAGDDLGLKITLESYLDEKREYSFDLALPNDIEPGQYKLLITGVEGYERFLRQNAPHKFAAENIEDLLTAVRTVLSIRRDRLYAVMLTGEKGVSIEQAQLPLLPQTKALILADGKRSPKAKPLKQWIENSIQIPDVTSDQQTVTITIEK
ncbi:MAG: SpoIVB peptidase S55 domain-containing protein [Phycisphaerae bacterium]|nr:SpoIVB peptidase S55 domain-containing protein [Phycisphaerae bacterium]